MFNKSDSYCRYMYLEMCYPSNGLMINLCVDATSCDLSRLRLIENRWHSLQDYNTAIKSLLWLKFLIDIKE